MSLQAWLHTRVGGRRRAVALSRGGAGPGPGAGPGGAGPEGEASSGLAGWL